VYFSQFDGSPQKPAQYKPRSSSQKRSPYKSSPNGDAYEYETQVAMQGQPIDASSLSGYLDEHAGGGTSGDGNQVARSNVSNMDI
jgi:hypothetical protein